MSVFIRQVKRAGDLLHWLWDDEHEEVFNASANIVDLLEFFHSTGWGESYHAARLDSLYGYREDNPCITLEDVLADPEIVQWFLIDYLLKNKYPTWQQQKNTQSIRTAQSVRICLRRGNQ